MTETEKAFACIEQILDTQNIAIKGLLDITDNLRERIKVLEAVEETRETALFKNSEKN